METKYANIGHKIQEARMSKELTQEEMVAKMQVEGCDLARSTLAQIESNLRYVKTSELECIAKILGVSIESLLDNSCN